MSSCAGRASDRSPVANICCADHYIWRVSPRFLSSANLFKEPECPPHMIPTKVIIGKVTATNWVPPVTPMRTLRESAHDPQKAKGCILDALDIQGLKDWSKKEWNQARELLVKWEHLFANSDLDLGKTSLIKHCIKLTDSMPFKEC